MSAKSRIPTGRVLRGLAIDSLNGRLPNKADIRRTFGATEKDADGIIADVEKARESIAQEALHRIPPLGSKPADYDR